MTEPQWQQLSRSETPLVSRVELPDGLTEHLIEPFDYKSDGTETFYPYVIPDSLPKEFGIGVIVGASGTGKSTLLRQFGEPARHVWTINKSIASHFNDPVDASERLSAAGLMSVPEWVKPFNALSNGQQFRANLARSLHDFAVIDEFTSVVDRNVAKAASTAMRRYVRNNNIQNIVLATVHRDILEFLEPDWIIDTDLGTWSVGRWLHRPDMVLRVHACKNSLWSHFASHHYLTETINKASHNYLAVWEEQLVGFVSVMAYPSGTVQNAFREHRLVIHPDYQGFGFGHALSELVAQHYIDNGKRYFSKTSHPRLGEYRDNSSLWKPTSKNHMRRKDIGNHGYTRWVMNPNRWSYSHEYIGKST